MLVFKSMDTIDSLTRTLQGRLSPNVKYAYVLDTGSIIKSTISEENLLQLIKFLPRICKELKPGTYLHKFKLYIYRLTTQFLLFLLSDSDAHIITELMDEIGDQYSLKIARDFKLKPHTSLGSIVKSIVFTVTTEKGPELMDWMVIDHFVNDKDAYKIAMKTMLNLTDELEGAKKRVLFFQPFLSYNCLGISYLFQIPFPGVRGGAFDSAISILVDFQYRPIIYSLYKELEEILHGFEPKIAKQFQDTYHQDVCLTRDDFNGILIDLKHRIDTIHLKLGNTDLLMEEMMNAVRELKELSP